MLCWIKRKLHNYFRILIFSFSNSLVFIWSRSLQFQGGGYMTAPNCLTWARAGVAAAHCVAHWNTHQGILAEITTWVLVIFLLLLTTFATTTAATALTILFFLLLLPWILLLLLLLPPSLPPLLLVVLLWSSVIMWILTSMSEMFLRKIPVVYDTIFPNR